MKLPSALRPSFRRPLITTADIAVSRPESVEYTIGPRKVRLVVMVAGVRTEEEANGRDHVLGLLRSMVMFALRAAHESPSLFDIGAVTRSVYDQLPKA